MCRFNSVKTAFLLVSLVNFRFETLVILVKSQIHCYLFLVFFEFLGIIQIWCTILSFDFPL